MRIHRNAKRPLRGTSRLIFAAIASAVALSSCAPSSPAHKVAEKTAPQATFSAEDRRIARALTVGAADVGAQATPRVYEMTCVLALDTVEGILDNRGLVTAEQDAVFKRAREVYWRRATTKLPQQDVAKLQSDVEARNPEPEGRARLAVGCLRELAN